MQPIHCGQAARRGGARPGRCLGHDLGGPPSVGGHHAVAARRLARRARRRRRRTAPRPLRAVGRSSATPAADGGRPRGASVGRRAPRSPRPARRTRSASAAACLDAARHEHDELLAAEAGGDVGVAVVLADHPPDRASSRCPRLPGRSLNCLKRSRSSTTSASCRRSGAAPHLVLERLAEVRVRVEAREPVREGALGERPGAPVRGQPQQVGGEAGGGHGDPLRDGQRQHAGRERGRVAGWPHRGDHRDGRPQLPARPAQALAARARRRRRPRGRGRPAPRSSRGRPAPSKVVWSSTVKLYQRLGRRSCAEAGLPVRGQCLNLSRACRYPSRSIRRNQEERLVE